MAFGCKIKFHLCFAIVFISCVSAKGDFPQYATNPFSFPIEDSVYGYGCGLFSVDLNGDTLLDYTYRSINRLYAYDHYGSLMWDAPISYPGPDINVYGTKHCAADVDNDGQVEILALNDSDQVKIYNGSNGNWKATIDVTVDTLQKAGLISIANFRGQGDRDIVIQTVDVNTEGDVKKQYYYVNRSIIAIRMDTYEELWRVVQDRNLGNGLYDGYWGPAHGTFQCVDADGDGKDEIVGGNMVDHTGLVIDLGYPRTWANFDTLSSDKLVDHLDAITVGDYRPDLPGLEWVVCEEDFCFSPLEWDAWHTTLISTNGILWRKETPDLPSPYCEPQEPVAGNFRTDSQFDEIWLSSRLPRLDRGYDSQRPWVFNYAGTQIASYLSKNVLPAGFNTHVNGNGQGIEPSCTIDWVGGKKEYLAARARHVDGNVGVFDAMTGAALWSTTGSVPAVQAGSFYVADVSGDGREEIIIHDLTDGKLKIYWNGSPNPNQPKPNKWDDPLYRRIKQNYCLYSTGGYTYGDYPLISNIRIDSISTSSVKILWDTDAASGSKIKYGFTKGYAQGTVNNPALVTAHAVKINGLEANTLYHFQIESANQYQKIGLWRDSTFQTPPVYAEIKIFLEGPYSASGDTMATVLNKDGHIPMASPYSEDPRTVTAIPTNVVDWVLIQLRTSVSGPAIASRSAFVGKNGMVVAENGMSTQIDIKAVEGYYYLLIKHRNHLAVMSSSIVHLSPETPVLYNFTTAANRYWGEQAKQVDTSPVAYGMYTGDANGDGQVQNSDKNSYWRAQVGASGYKSADFNLNGQVQNNDKNSYWRYNVGKGTQVP